MSSSYHDATLPLGQPEIVPEAGPEHGLQGHNFKDIMGFKSWSRKHLEPANGKDKGKCFPPREDLEALQQESVLAADAQARQLLTLVDSSLPPTPTRQEVSMGRGMGRVRARYISNRLPPGQAHLFNQPQMPACARPLLWQRPGSEQAACRAPVRWPRPRQPREFYSNLV